MAGLLYTGGQPAAAGSSRLCSRVVYVGADVGRARRGRGESSRLKRFERGGKGQEPSVRVTRLARRDVSCRLCWPHAAPDGRTAARGSVWLLQRIFSRMFFEKKIFYA
jgi:hypothetical protein